MCLLDTLLSSAETAELIEVSFGLWNRLCSRSQLLDGGRGRGSFGGRHTVDVATCCVLCLHWLPYDPATDHTTFPRSHLVSNKLSLVQWMIALVGISDLMLVCFSSATAAIMHICTKENAY